MSSLRNVITQLASQFATGVLNAIRGASLEEILAETRGGAAVLAAARRPGRPAGGGEAEAAPRAGKPRRGRGGRLSRRSAEDIGEVVERIVTLLGQNPKGLRAEQIRQKLGLEAKELPRPIAEALASKKVSKQGQKRATTYFAGGGRAGAGAAPKAGKAAKAGRPAKKAAKKTAKRAAKPVAAKAPKAAKAAKAPKSKKPAAAPPSPSAPAAAAEPSA